MRETIITNHKYLLKKIFPGRIIKTVDYNEVALENCTTWTLKE